MNSLHKIVIGLFLKIINFDILKTDVVGIHFKTYIIY